MTLPAIEDEQGHPVTEHIIVTPFYVDPDTKELYVHKDLLKVRDAWEVEEHAPPVKSGEVFGDVESWAKYVTRYSDEDCQLLTWNSKGLRAVLDYHIALAEGAMTGRCQWTATYPFEPSPELAAWQRLTSGGAFNQKQTVEALEDRGEDITDPPATDLMALLRSLRATVNTAATTELRPDGTAAIAFNQERRVNGAPTSMELPPTISIAIPILKGHPDKYRLDVRVRVSVDDSAHLTFRFSIPNAERALEVVYAERVEQAKTLLGDAFTILRANG